MVALYTTNKKNFRKRNCHYNRRSPIYMLLGLEPVLNSELPFAIPSLNFSLTRIWREKSWINTFYKAIMRKNKGSELD